MLDRAHKALRVGIRVGCLKRCLHHADSGSAQPLTNSRAPLHVPVANQHAMADQHRFVRRGERAAHLAHEQVVGRGRRAHDVHRRDARWITNTV